MSSSSTPSARSLPIPLDEREIPIGQPLASRIVDADGRLLLDRGAVLSGVLDRTALCRFFRPHRDADMRRDSQTPHPVGATAAYPDAVAGTPAGATAGAIVNAGQSIDPAGAVQTSKEASPTQTRPPAAATPKTDRGIAWQDMRLTIDTRLGVRPPLGAGKLTYASRVLGIASHGGMFIAPPTLGRERLTVTAGEQVELVAVGARALFLFPSTVEAVCARPFPYLVLSAPGFIRRVRERRAVRVPTRLAVLFRSEADVEGLGVVLDINTLGVSLFTDIPLGKVGDKVQLMFYIEQARATNAYTAAEPDRADSDPDSDAEQGHATRIEIASVIRSLTPSRLADEVAATMQYGLEFNDLRPDVRRAMRAYVTDCRLAELGQQL